MPVALKGIYHVVGMMTAAGAGSFGHERPVADATAVARFRAAGAVILGKRRPPSSPTGTLQFAYRDPTETRNPWSLDHSPGGSSSGSAAAVAARMVPFALGTQTVGSTIKPAGYCRIVGFKPTYGRISCAGVVPLAWSFDTVGIFCRHVEDAALGLSILSGFDPADLASVDLPTGSPSAVAETVPRLGVPWGLVQTATEGRCCVTWRGWCWRPGARVCMSASSPCPRPRETWPLRARLS